MTVGLAGIDTRCAVSYECRFKPGIAGGSPLNQVTGHPPELARNFQHQLHLAAFLAAILAFS